MTGPSVEGVQRAAAFVGARSRGDADGAQRLFVGFGSDAERTISFVLLAELAVRLLGDREVKPAHVVAQELALMIAQAGVTPGPWADSGGS